MTAIKAFSNNRRLCSALLVGTMLGGMAAPAYAQQTAMPAQTATPAQTITPAPVAAPAPGAGTVRSITVRGNQRLERETVISYMPIQVGQPYDREKLDQAIVDLYATELFADVVISGADTGNIVVQVRENPVINRIVLEGNKKLKEDKITPEIRLAPRQIFTASKARADVARIIELYRRQGRYGATVEPKIVQLEQNRVDVVFEINEGEVSKIRQINIIGNNAFSDSELRGEMFSRQARLTSFLSGNTSYDPDRLAADQQKLRLFYLTNGYADFRVISSVAELTPDRRDFIITYVVEEGERYKFGDIRVDSEIRDFTSATVRPLIPIKTGDWYDAKRVEDSIKALSESAGISGYAFAEVEPQFARDAAARTMSVLFKIAEAPRTYVERIDIAGNTITRDKVIRREFRLAEGDAFNSIRIRRSRDRIQSLGYFQNDLEIEQQPGSAPDRVVLAVNVEEQQTGEISFSAGFSSIERFLLSLALTQRNFMGKGQTVRAGLNYSTYAKSGELSFWEPYLFDRNISVGADLYRRDFNSFNFSGSGERNTTYQQVVTGGALRAAVPLTEYMVLGLRYSLSLDEITLDESIFYSADENGQLFCDPSRAGRYLCDAVGKRTTSALGYTLSYNTLDNRLRPTRGMRAAINQDLAALGGDVGYLRSVASVAKYWPVFNRFIFSTSFEGGYIHSLEKSERAGVDPIRLTDRFTLGEPQLRGFDIRGIGPRVQRRPLDANDQPITDPARITDDALGGRAFYLLRNEIEIPVSASVRELGLRPSIFLDVGAVFGLVDPITNTFKNGDPRLTSPVLSAEGLRQCTTGGVTPVVTPLPAGQAACPSGASLFTRQIAAPFEERYLGDTWKPRVSIGFGVNWNSPFGPFRIDIAKALLKQEGDDTKLFTFNVGTQF